MNLYNNYEIYQAKTDYDRLLRQLKIADDHMIPTISSRVDLNNYAKKIIDFGVVYYITDKGKDIGHCAIYANNPPNGFITSFSIHKEYWGKGLSDYFLKTVLSKIKNEYDELTCVRLQVFKENLFAVAFYLRNGFVVYQEEIEYLLMEVNIGL